MKRSIMAAAGALALFAAGPATAAPKEPKPNYVASQICKAEKQADKAAFKATYGKNAMRDCKRAHRSEAREAIRNASQECRAERDADPEGFATTYGANPNGRNAFGKCVSSKVGEEPAEEAEEFANAAKECRAERSADADAFAETYGTNRNKRNAFGKCVSQKAKAAGESEPEGPESA
jgi:hypothetical protein